jgi:hypothetical protein
MRTANNTAASFAHVSPVAEGTVHAAINGLYRDRDRDQKRAELHNEIEEKIAEVQGAVWLIIDDLLCEDEEYLEQCIRRLARARAELAALAAQHNAL